MFLEELKSDESDEASGASNHNQRYSHNAKYNQRNAGNFNYNNSSLGPSSLGSGSNLEMNKQQEESFSQMQHEISSLHNKIRGLEQKLAPIGILSKKEHQNESYNSVKIKT